LRELSIDVAERKSILKNHQNTLYPYFIFTPKTGESSLEQVFDLSVFPGYYYYCVKIIKPVFLPFMAFFKLSETQFSSNLHPTKHRNGTASTISCVFLRKPYLRKISNEP